MQSSEYEGEQLIDDMRTVSVEANLLRVRPVFCASVGWAGSRAPMVYV